MADSSPFHILVVGGGALGGYYGSVFHQPDLKILVSVVCRSNYNAVSQHGIVIKTNKSGQYSFIPHQVFENVSSAVQSGIPFQIILVCCKNIPEMEPMEVLLEPIVNTCSLDPLVILMQNGIGIEQAVQSKHPHLLLASAVLYFAASQSHQEPGVIHFNDDSVQKVVFGLFSGPHLTKERGEKGIRLLEQLVNTAKTSLQANLRIIPPADMFMENVDYQAVRWHKVSWNASFGPVCILSQAHTLSVLQNAHTMQLVKDIMLEVFQTAEAFLKSKGSHIPFPPPGLFTIEEYIQISWNLGPYKPSVQLDYDYRRPFELQVLLGNVIDIAKECQVSTPCLHTVYSILNLVFQQRLEDLQKSRTQKE